MEKHVRTSKPILSTIILSVGFAFLLVASVHAQDTIESYYQDNCKACHNIGGGDGAGPDLLDLDKRRDQDWVARFLKNPAEMVKTDDDARRMKEKFGMVMQTPPNLSDERITALWELIKRESANPASQFRAVEMSERPFTEEDVALGHQLFTGEVGLQSGGPACIACHTVTGLDSMGGGQLGPDLTKIYEERGGRSGLGQWLTAPATPVMKVNFQDHPLDAEAEILPMLAFLESVNGNARKGSSRLVFVLLAFLVTGGFLALADVVWRKRFRGVRKNLVRTKGAKE
jgi:mono/diheme cytochrome c family protein